MRVSAFQHQSLRCLPRAHAPRLSSTGSPRVHSLHGSRVTQASLPQVRTRANLFGGEGGGMGNLMENMKKAQALVQEEAGKVQAELAGTEFDGYDEEETVKVVFLGNQEPKGVELTQAAMECTAEELSLRIKQAMTDAHQKSVAGMRTKMTDLAKKLGLPESMQNPGGL